MKAMKMRVYNVMVIPTMLYDSETWTMMKSNVVEPHCYALQCRRIDCEQFCSRINQQLIAGRFGHEGLRQLRTKPKEVDTHCVLVHTSTHSVTYSVSFSFACS